MGPERSAAALRVSSTAAMSQRRELVTHSIGNGWRVAGAMSPARIGLSSEQPGARAAERQDPFQEATGAPVMR